MLRARHTREVHTITGARRAVPDDVNSRAHRYLVSMGIRTVCVLLAIFVDGWPRVVFIVAAVLLPYVSVVFANSGRERIETMPTVTGLEDRRALGPAPDRVIDTPREDGRSD